MVLPNFDNTSLEEKCQERKYYAKKAKRMKELYELQYYIQHQWNEAKQEQNRLNYWIKQYKQNDTRKIKGLMPKLIR